MKWGTKLVLGTFAAGAGAVGAGIVAALTAPTPGPSDPGMGRSPMQSATDNDLAKYNEMLRRGFDNLSPGEQHWVARFEGRQDPTYA